MVSVKHSDHTGRYAVLYPAIAEAARRCAAERVGLIDVGRPAGLNLNVDRVGIFYGDNQTLGDVSSPVQLECLVVGDRRIPSVPIPDVAARIVLDRAPLDMCNPVHRNRIRPADDRSPHLDDEIALAESSPPQQISGEPITALADAVSCVPDRALPVVITTWSLSRFSPERRRRFVHALGEVSSARRTAWVSVEGVGVVPTIPTLGDRPVSGHSIIGLTVFEPSTALPRFDVAGDALGRCWSRGRFMSWFA
ncbi:DUF2332 family protein [Gordonia amicalis]|nr:DUF2332 family protein [Gordonia amicalis]